MLSSVMSSVILRDDGWYENCDLDWEVEHTVLMSTVWFCEK